MAPTILFVPGIWVGPTVFRPVSSLLNADGLSTETAVLPSTGTTSPGNPGMKDDIAAVRKHIEQLVSRGEDVVLVLHSAGGFIGSAAMEGLSKKARVEKGEPGGVASIVFLSGAVFPEGCLLRLLRWVIPISSGSYFTLGSYKSKDLPTNHLLLSRAGLHTAYSQRSFYLVTSPRMKRQNGWLT
jgi:pimeloyl-ACP methyl ester carboxylesterase